MTDTPTHRDQLPRIGRRPGANPVSVRTADPALEAVRDAVRGRLTEIVSAGVPDGSGVETLLERDREDLASTATVFLTRAAPDREAASAVLAASTAALHDRLALATADGTVRRFLVDTADGIFTNGGGALTLVEIHTGPTPENNFARFDSRRSAPRQGFRCWGRQRYVRLHLAQRVPADRLGRRPRIPGTGRQCRHFLRGWLGRAQQQQNGPGPDDGGVRPFDGPTHRTSHSGRRQHGRATSELRGLRDHRAGGHRW